MTNDMRNRLGYVYVLTNKNNCVLYVGSSSNLVRRIKFHKKAYLRGFTRNYNVNKLVYYGVFADIVSARRRERQIKGWRREKKIRLIESMNPKWMDLYNGLKGFILKEIPPLHFVQGRDEGSEVKLPDPSNSSKWVWYNWIM
jgi:putative endonuclease